MSCEGYCDDQAQHYRSLRFVVFIDLPHDVGCHERDGKEAVIRA